MADSIPTLKRWLERAPDNHDIRLRLADHLRAAGLVDQALEEYAHLALHGELPKNRIPTLGRLAAAKGHLDLARHCLSTAERAGISEEVRALKTEVGRLEAVRESGA